MDQIIIRYGETVTLPIDTGDATATAADIYVGKPGQVYVLTSHIDLVGGTGTFVLSSSSTKIPLDTYYYQINVTDANGYTEKYPTVSTDCDGCDSEFPEFVVLEALDEIEVS